eukprot:scaffold102873_cov60-Phaeocystis_antarctica.AAC.1
MPALFVCVSVRSLFAFNPQRQTSSERSLHWRGSPISAWRYARRRAGGLLAERLTRCVRHHGALAHGSTNLEQDTSAATTSAATSASAASSTSVASATSSTLSTTASVTATPVTAASTATTESSSTATAAGLDDLRRRHHNAGHAQPERGRALRTLTPRVGRPLHAGDPAAEHRDGQRGAALGRVGLAGGAGGRRRGARRCGPRLAALALARPAEDAPRRRGEAAALLGRAALPRGRAREARWPARAARRLPRRRLPARPVLHRARARQAAGCLHGGLPPGLQQLGHQPGPRAAVLRQGGGAAGAADAAPPRLVQWCDARQRRGGARLPRCDVARDVGEALLLRLPAARPGVPQLAAVERRARRGRARVLGRARPGEHDRLARAPLPRPLRARAQPGGRGGARGAPVRPAQAARRFARRE